MGRFRTQMDQMLKEQNRLLCNILTDARSRAHLTQSGVAAQFGRKQPFIARIESGLRRVTFVELEQFAKIYGKQLSSFETRTEIERLYPELINPDRILHTHPDWYPKKKDRRRR
jgi:transcriptional regulator with XRE-family HTH domain